MSQPSQEAVKQWERSLCDAWANHLYVRCLDPLLDTLLAWRDGEVAHSDADYAVFEAHRELRRAYASLNGSRQKVCAWAMADTTWFAEWVKDHPPPKGLVLRRPASEPPE